MSDEFRRRIAEERASQGLGVRADDALAVAAMARLMAAGDDGFEEKGAA